MKRPAIGRLRHRLTLESASRTPDGGGGASETWSTVTEVWAEITPTSGAEAVDADAPRRARLARDRLPLSARRRAGHAPAQWRPPL